MIGAGSGESPDKVSVGDAYTFSVDSPTSPHVEVLGPARRPVTVQVSNFLLKVLFFNFFIFFKPIYMLCYICMNQAMNEFMCIIGKYNYNMLYFLYFREKPGYCNFLFTIILHQVNN